MRFREVKRFALRPELAPSPRVQKILRVPPYSLYSSVRIKFFQGKHVRNTASLVFLRLEYVVQTLKGEREEKGRV